MDSIAAVYGSDRRGAQGENKSSGGRQRLSIRIQEPNLRGNRAPAL